MDVSLFVGFLFVLLGVVWRTVRPWMLKVKAAEIRNAALVEAGKDAEPVLKFGPQYMLSGVITFVSCMVVAAFAIGSGNQSVTLLLSHGFENAIPLFLVGAGATEALNRELL